MRVGGMLAEDAAGGHRSKHPQPVLDPLPSDLYEGSIADATRPGSEPHADPGIQAINGHAAADVPPAADFVFNARRTSGARDVSPGKPKFLRAKSDFGPRKERHLSHDSSGLQSPTSPLPEEGTLFRMRHGWEAQLQSDEQANLLSQVCTCLSKPIMRVD